MITKRPVIEQHGKFYVARDDLIPGGTKARFLGVLFEPPDVREVVYASPVQGAAQIALAVVAEKAGKLATVFVARRKKMHRNTEVAVEHGAQIQEVAPPAFLSVVQKRARDYVVQTAGAVLAPFGLRIPEASICICRACKSIRDDFDEVWCAAGSGTLACALCDAFPEARVVAVSVGHKLKSHERGRADVLIYHAPYERRCKVEPPFPSNRNYDAKAWELMQEQAAGERVLFWNVDRDHG